MKEGSLEKIQRMVKEVILGNDKNLSELKKLVEDFFKGKTQKDFDKIEKKKLQTLTKSYDILIKKAELNDIDRAFLDVYFNEKPIKYICLDLSCEINEEKLKRFAREIYDRRLFGKEESKNFMSFIGLVLVYEDFWDDITLESEDKDLHLKLSFHHEMKKPEMTLFIVGTKKYEELIEKLNEIFNLNLK